MYIIIFKQLNLWLSSVTVSKEGKNDRQITRRGKFFIEWKIYDMEKYGIYRLYVFKRWKVRLSMARFVKMYCVINSAFRREVIVSIEEEISIFLLDQFFHFLLQFLFSILFFFFFFKEYITQMHSKNTRGNFLNIRISLVVAVIFAFHFYRFIYIFEVFRGLVRYCAPWQRFDESRSSEQ